MESPGKAAIKKRVGYWVTVGCRELRLGVDWSGRGVAITHTCPGKNFENILALREMKLVWLAGDKNAKEVMERAKVFHGEFVAEASDNGLKEWGRRGCKNNVVNV